MIMLIIGRDMLHLAVEDLGNGWHLQPIKGLILQKNRDVNHKNKFAAVTPSVLEAIVEKKKPKRKYQSVLLIYEVCSTWHISWAYNVNWPLIQKIICLFKHFPTLCGSVKANNLWEKVTIQRHMILREKNRQLWYKNNRFTNHFTVDEDRSKASDGVGH